MDDGRGSGKGDVAGKMGDHLRRAAASREGGRRRGRETESVVLFAVVVVVVVDGGVVDGERGMEMGGKGRDGLK